MSIVGMVDYSGGLALRTPAQMEIVTSLLLNTVIRIVRSP